MKYVFLTKQFYKDYSHCSEIEQKQYRPYVMLLIDVEGLLFALPMRSHIKHKYAYFTNKQNGCGIDYSKAVVITDEKLYIDTKRPTIRNDEYKILLGKDYIVSKEFKKYLRVRKNPKNDNFLRFSAPDLRCAKARTGAG